MLDRFLYWIERHRIAVLAALGAHLVVFVWSALDTVEVPLPVKDRFEFVAPMVEEEEEETIPLELDQEYLERLGVQDHDLAVGGDADKRQFSDDYSRGVSQSDIEKRVRDYEKQFIQEAESDNPNYEVPELESHKKVESQFRNDGEASKGKARRPVVKLILKGRDDTEKCATSDIPAYKSYGSGVVTMRVKVDRAGYVKDAEFVPSQSKGATEHMINESHSYAMRAKFCSGSASSATGYIRFTYFGQR